MGENGCSDFLMENFGIPSYTFISWKNNPQVYLFNNILVLTLFNTTFSY